MPGPNKIIAPLLLPGSRNNILSMLYEFLSDIYYTVFPCKGLPIDNVWRPHLNIFCLLDKWSGICCSSESDQRIKIYGLSTHSECKEDWTESKANYDIVCYASEQIMQGEWEKWELWDYQDRRQAFLYHLQENL